MSISLVTRTKDGLYEYTSNGVKFTSNEEIKQKEDKIKLIQSCLNEDGNPREVKSIKIGDLCIETIPCYHYVTIEFSDGEVHKNEMNGRDIYNNFLYNEKNLDLANLLSENDKKHFKTYKYIDENFREYQLNQFFKKKKEDYDETDFYLKNYIKLDDIKERTKLFKKYPIPGCPLLNEIIKNKKEELKKIENQYDNFLNKYLSLDVIKHKLMKYF